MADFYKQKDVQALLKHRKILFLGDSNVRPLYKDLTSALKRKKLISVETLKNPNVVSYWGDIAVHQCGRKNEWTFWENRIFEEGPWRVEMFCTGRVLIREILQFISKFPQVPSSIPDVVYVSFDSSHGKNTRSLVSKLLVDLKMNLPCNTLVLVGSSFPTVMDMFGDPRFDEVPFFSMGSLPRDGETEKEIVDRVSFIGFHYLNIAHYLRKNVFRGMTTEHGWESVLVRYTTFLLLTYIANSLFIKTPNRVNQDVLHKAISSANDETELYNNLLMKHANNWMWVKSHSLTDAMDLTASNAYEITQMLWKTYHRSRSHHSPRPISGCRTRSHYRNDNQDEGYSRKIPISPERGSSMEGCKERRIIRSVATPSIESATCSSATTEVVDTPCETSIEQKRDHEKQDDLLNKAPPGGHVKLCSMNKFSQLNSSPFDAGQGSTDAEYDKQSENFAEKDEESLEEGEIPDSPIGRSEEQKLVQTDSNYSDITLSDESSSEGEIDVTDTSSASFERVVVPSVTPYLQNYQNYPSPYEYHNYQIHVPNYGATTQIQGTTTLESAITIEVSDDEPVHQELNSYDADEAIINLSSEEESWDSKSLYIEKHELRQPPPKEKRKERSYQFRGKDKLRLMIAEGNTISWPSDKARLGQDTLWKWWRRHIELNNGLMIICHPGIEKINGMIPSLTGKKATCIAIPKIVDDVQQFLTCLDEAKFPEYFIDPRENECTVNETFRKLNDKSSKTMKLLPLAEELSRGSVKRINFQISKKITSVSARITIKEFASIRNLTSTSRQNSTLDIPREPVASSSSNFYSYGEQMSSISVLSTDNTYKPPHAQCITSPKIDTEKSKTRSSQVLKEASESQETCSSTESLCRRGKTSLYEETDISNRRWERTSSFPDHSVFRDQSYLERHWHLQQNTDEHRYRYKEPYDRYVERSLSDGSED